MNHLLESSKKIKKIEKKDFRRKHKKETPHFSTKMNENNTFFEEKPDFDFLALKYPDFEPYVFINENGMTTIDWSNHQACIELNRALLHEYYGITFWTIPKDYLCPTITSRVNYLNWISDLLKETGIQEKDIKGLDIGTGASLIYPILGYKIYGWRFIGTDINDDALKNAQSIIDQNDFGQKIELRKSNNDILKNIVKENERFTFCMCNPPYFGSIEEKASIPSRECNAQEVELVTEGGEEKFVSRMISESLEFREQFHIFTSLIGRKRSLQTLKTELETLKLKSKEEKSFQVQIFETTFYQGKTLRWGLAWRFISLNEKII